MKANGLLASIALVGVSNLWAKGTIFLITVLAAQLLSTQSFALFSIFAMILFSVANVIGAAFGLGVLRYVADEPDTSKQIAHNRAVGQIAFGVTIVFGVATITWLHYAVIPLSLADSASIVGALLASIVYACCLGNAQGQKRFLSYALASFIGGGLYMGSAAIGLYWFGPIAIFPSVLIGCLAGAMYLAKSLSSSGLFPLRLVPFTAENRCAVASFTKVILPAALAGFITVPSVWLVMHELNSQGEFFQVALYSVALQIRNIITLLPATFGAALLPFIASAKDQVSLRKTDFYLSYGVSYGVIFPLILFPQLSVSLFGEKYADEAGEAALYMLFSAVIICYKASIGRQLVIAQQGFLSVVSNGSWLCLYLLLFYLAPENAGAADYARYFFYSMAGHLVLWFPYYLNKKLLDGFQYRGPFIALSVFSLIGAYFLSHDRVLIGSIALFFYITALCILWWECFVLVKQKEFQPG